MTPRPVFAYAHIHKTGGTSMRESLAELFGRERIVWHGFNGLHLGDMIRERIPLPDCDVVGGHVPAKGLMRLVTERPLIAVALLRNPAQQIVSYYHELAKKPHDRFHFPGPLLDALAPNTAFAMHARGLQSLMLCGAPSGHAALGFLATVPHLVARLDKAQVVLDRIAALAGLDARVALRSENRRGAEPEALGPAILERLRPLAAPDRVLWHHFHGNGGVSERLTRAAA